MALIRGGNSTPSYIPQFRFWFQFHHINLNCIDIRHTQPYYKFMVFDWDEEKNAELKERRNISFEEIMLCIYEDKIVDVIKNPNEKNYPKLPSS